MVILINKKRLEKVLSEHKEPVLFRSYLNIIIAYLEYISMEPLVKVDRNFLSF